MNGGRFAALVAGVMLGVPGPATAAAAPVPVPDSAASEITIVGATPLPGIGIDVDKVAGQVQTLSAFDISRAGAASLSSAINSSLGSANFNDNLDDPFQPDILYRGFEASPVLGTPQGLAVYQDGVRINEAFGDAVNWDLVPDVAVDRIDVLGANPVYGLNALGGAVVISMKNGFTYQGGEAEASGGSWRQRQGSLQYGANRGAWGFYAAARLLKEGGWRRFSPDSVMQFHDALGFHAHGWVVDLGVTGARNSLSGESPSPVQELAVNRSLIFTSPQGNDDHLLSATLNVTYEASSKLALQGSAHVRDSRQSVVNGNRTGYTACADDTHAGDLCQGDGSTPLKGADGALLPDISRGGSVHIGEIDFEAIGSLGVGASVQATSAAPLFGHDNYFAIGASADRASTHFASWVEAGIVNPALVVQGSGYYVSTPERTPFAATPVSLDAGNRYWGLYFTDTWSPRKSLAITVGGRFNSVSLNLSDRLGDALGGNSRYSRFNPALGITGRWSERATAYAGYSEGARAPTASEIECSDPRAPCLLPSSLSSDPPTLGQVVSHSWELGLRSRAPTGIAGHERMKWNVSLFRTDVRADIYAVATSSGSGYFRNIGGTRRAGIDVGTRYEGAHASAFVNYSYVSATFESAFLLPSQFNAGARSDGNIAIRQGDALPGIPVHRIRAGIEGRPFASWIIGAGLVYESRRYLRGDESNQMPALPGFLVCNLHAKYQLNGRTELYASIANLFNRRYATFGMLGDPTGVGAPGIPANPGPGDAGVDHRFVAPAPPTSAFAGVRVRF